jgi:hypothetical protein
MPFDEHIAALQNIEANTDFIVLRIIQALEEIILKFQREQLAQGELETGSPITPNYHPLTVTLRKVAGLQVAFPDLNFTGQHYSNFYIDFGNDWFEITNDDPKAPKLVAKYSKAKGSIYGLNDVNLQKIIEDVKPLLIDKIREKLLA